MTLAAAEADAPRKRRSWVRRGSVTAAVVLALLAGLAALLRFGALTPFGRSLAEQALDGLNVGGYGRLHVEGLGGDVWRDFTLRRLTIADGHGVWLDAHAVRIRWDWPELLARRLKTISDPTRLAMLEAIRGAPYTVSDLATHFSLAQPTVSNHLKLLREAGIVSNHTVGGRRMLTVQPDVLADLVDHLGSLFALPERAGAGGGS